MSNKINSIVISADHGGFELKNELKTFLSENYPEIEIIDAGAFEYDAEDDFPDMTNKLTEIMHNGDAEKGIAICGSGVGASIVANNNMNVLCMGGRVIKIDEAKKIVKSFLDASFIDEEKYVRRLNKINKLD